MRIERRDRTDHPIQEASSPRKETKMLFDTNFTITTGSTTRTEDGEVITGDGEMTDLKVLDYDPANVPAGIDPDLLTDLSYHAEIFGLVTDGAHYVGALIEAGYQRWILVDQMAGYGVTLLREVPNSGASLDVLRHDFDDDLDLMISFVGFIRTR
jgi:hypothetical protein